MSEKFILFLNNGHGGEIDGIPVTAGKRSPDDSGEFRFIEGTFNRIIVDTVVHLADSCGFDSSQIRKVCDTQRDLPMKSRTDYANSVAPKNSFYLSIHADAAPVWYIKSEAAWRRANMRNSADYAFVIKNQSDRSICVAKNEWSDARGMSIYTSVGQTKSDRCADILYEEFVRAELEKYTGKIRVQKSQDGDVDYEANFWELNATVMPAVLIESGYMTNKEDVAAMKSREYQFAYAKAIIRASERIKQFILFGR